MVTARLKPPRSEAQSPGCTPGRGCWRQDHPGHLGLAWRISSTAANFPGPYNINPDVYRDAGVGDKDLAVTYFHMGRPHTIIGDTPFHF